MPSYQDIEQRLRTVEDKVDFVMTTMRMRAILQSGILDPNGNPVGQQTFDGTMLEFYRLTRQGVIEQVPVEQPPDTRPAPELAEEVNG